MKWTKRLKWLRLSKVIIPIALAISLVFTGFSVYANEAENFVVRIDDSTAAQIALALKDDLSDATSRLYIPVEGRYTNATWSPNNKKYDPTVFGSQLPDDIAKYEGVHPVYLKKNTIAFYSFSFWLINVGHGAVDIDMSFDIDSMVTANNKLNYHIDDAVRIMLIDGNKEDNVLLSQNNYSIYKKAEKNEENERYVQQHVEYNNDNVYNFISDQCVMERKGDMGFRSFPAGAKHRFTVVIWLEGWDVECVDAIWPESLKMSINFSAH